MSPNGVSKGVMQVVVHNVLYRSERFSVPILASFPVLVLRLRYVSFSDYCSLGTSAVAMEQWDSLFSNLVAFLHLTAGRDSSATRNVVEATLVKVDNYIRVLSAIRGRLQSSIANRPDPELEDVERDISGLLANLEVIKGRWEDRDTEVSVSALVAECQRSGSRGRPKVFTSKEQIEFLRELRLSWTEIASLFGICRRTLYRIRSEYGLMDTYNFTNIPDRDLDRQVTLIKNLMPEVGQSMVKGALQARQIYVSFSRVQESITRVDPVATALRWSALISRRTYSVSGPNALWHMDGNHKLVR